MITPRIVPLPVVGVSDGPGLTEISTDLIMLTKFAGMGLFPGLQAVDAALNGLVSRKIKQARFKGELGECLHVEVDPKAYPNYPQRHILLVGLGSAQQFGPKAVCQIFQVLLDKALELGVEHVTIQIGSNRMTGANPNLKGTAHLLNEVVESRLSSVTPAPKLQEIGILCTPQAKRYLNEGLAIPSRHGRSCCTDVV